MFFNVWRIEQIGRVLGLATLAVWGVTGFGVWAALIPTGISAFFYGLAPLILFATCLILAWRRSEWGAWGFLILGGFYLITTNWGFNFSLAGLLPLLPILAGAAFLRVWWELVGQHQHA